MVELQDVKSFNSDFLIHTPIIKDRNAVQILAPRALFDGEDVEEKDEGEDDKNNE